MPPKKQPPQTDLSAEHLVTLTSVRNHVARSALAMVDWANNKPENKGSRPKIGGHQASSMSSVDLLCALYLHTKEAQDRVAVKPHAAPVIYALMHLLGELETEQCDMLREYKGLQPYPTKLKNPRFIDYTTSSEALGVCATIYDAYGAFVQNRGLCGRTEAKPVHATYWAHCGDGELTEGQIDESLYDAGRWGLDNLVWIVDLNRQSLDRIMDDTPLASGRLEDWVSQKFQSQGWHVINLRWGAQAEALFNMRGGKTLQKVLETAPDALLQPLYTVTPAVAHAVLRGDVEDLPEGYGPWLQAWAKHVGKTQQGTLTRLVSAVEPEVLASGIQHLGGHDLAALIEAYDAAKKFQGMPVVVIAHTLKGYQTSAAGHPENHGALLPTSEVLKWGIEWGLPPDTRHPIPAEATPEGALLKARREVLFPEPELTYMPWPHRDLRTCFESIPVPKRKQVSTGEAFQSVNLALLRTEVADYLHFGAPDVGQTTHLGPVIKSTGVFAPRELPDYYGWLRDVGQVAFDWRPTPTGQFHSLGIAEGNAMLWAYAFGRRKYPQEGKEPLLTVVTVYDKFFERGFNQIDYAAYSGARFVAVGTPSGTGLSREAATHQSIQTLRMMMDLPGILAYEPAFGADVHALYLFALAQCWDDDGESVYLRLTTQPVAQPQALPDNHAEQAISGAYWLVGEDARDAEPGKGTVVLVASGRKVADVRKAAAILHEEDGVGSRILNVTSYEALWRDWDAFVSDPAAWDDEHRTYRLHELFDDDLLNAPLLIVGDHVPSVAEWLPGALQRIRGHRFLGPRTNGEAGALAAIDALHGMAVEDIVRVAREELSWRR